MFSIGGLDEQQTEIVLIDTVWISLCCIIIFVITLYSFHQLCWQDSSDWINKTYKNLTMIIMVTYFGSNIGELIFIVSIYFFKQTRDDIIYPATDIGVNILYHFGNFIFYILLFLRIAVPFELNRCITYWLRIVIFISGVTSIVYIIGLFLLYGKAWNFWKGIAILLSVTDFILNALILFIFVRKIKKTVSNIDPTSSIQAQKNVNIMTNVVAKHGLLFGTAILLNQVFLVTILVNMYIGSGLVSFISDISVTFARTLERTANVLVLWLILRANYDKYICLCKYCHLFCAKCCFKNVDTKQVVQNPSYPLLTEK